MNEEFKLGSLEDATEFAKKRNYEYTTMSEGNKEFIYEGKRYRYDPDYDYFRRVDDDPETKLSKFGWIVLVAILGLWCLWLS